ncbi:hypothetical protein Tco_0117640 [Tanacetum coccineum]
MIFEDYCSDNQYAVFIKEDTVYLYLHSPKTTKETRSNTPYPEEGNTPYLSYMKIKYSGRYQTLSLLQETPDTPEHDQSGTTSIDQEVPQAVLHKVSGRPYYHGMVNIRLEPQVFPDQQGKKVPVGSASSTSTKCKSQRGAMIKSNTNMEDQKGLILDSGNPEEDSKDYAILNMNPKGREEYGKGTIKTSCIDFEKVSYVEELKFNLLSVSQICDKKHNVLFTDKECLILSPKFKFVETDLNAFEEEKRRIALEKGKESANSTLTLSTANTPSQSTGNTLIGFFDADSDDDIPKDGVFSTNSFDDEKIQVNEEDGAL